MKLRFSDVLEMTTEMGSTTFTTVSAQWKDVCVSQSFGEHGLKVTLSADETPVKYIRLRWNFTADERRTEPVRILGDEWERGYGEMEWRGIVAERNMPWVCAVSNGTDSHPDTAGRYTECFGVMVRPAGFCMWRYDSHGVTLEIDVRNGGSGVILSGRRLDVCEIRFGEYRDVSAFAALVGFGGAPRASIYMGRKDKESAEKTDRKSVV